MARKRGVEPEALEALYRSRFHAFLRVAEAVCGDADLARDAVQEAFASALRSRGSFRGDGSLEAWVWRMVVNSARKARQRRADETPRPVVDLGAHPRVGWYERGEQRGVSLDQITLTPEQREQFADAATMGGLRLVKPDPTSGLVVGLAGNICLVGPGGSRGCITSEDVFDWGPVYFLGSSDGTGFVLSGLVSDGVARVRIFLADGLTLTPPLRDNLFAARVAVEQSPFRIVSYDRRGRIVGVFTLPQRSVRDTAPPTARQLHFAGAVRGPNGGRATFRRGPAAGGYRCWRVTFSPGPARGGCERAANMRLVQLVQQAGDDLFLVGTTYPATRRIEVRFRDGKTVVTRPVAGHLVFPLPSDRLSTSRHAATVIGRNREGRVIQRQEVAFRLSR